MYKEIKLGEKTVPMIANAATALRYKLVFGKELIGEFQNIESDAVRGMNTLPELTFIMAKAAEAKEGKADMNKLNQEIYIEWLEQFDPMDIPDAASDILDLYMGNTKTTSEPKKNESAKVKEK